MNTQTKYIIIAVSILFTTLLLITILYKLASTSFQDSSGPIIIDNLQENNSTHESIRPGKILFQTHCASCHNILKETAYPALLDFEKRGPWTNRNILHSYLKDPASFSDNKYIRELREKYKTIHPAFRELKTSEIDAICDYINITGLH